MRRSRAGARRAEARGMSPLWTIRGARRRHRRPAARPAARTSVTGISIDSRTLGPGDVFFAIKGERLDGHDFVDRGAARPARRSLVVTEQAAGARTSAPLARRVRRSCSRRWSGSASPARARMHGEDRRGHRLGRQDQHQGDAAPRWRRRAQVHACAGDSFNNHWGVPLTLARMPADADYGIFEIGMNHAGEIRRWSKMVRPHVAIVTTVEPVHLGFFRNRRRRSPRPRPRFSRAGAGRRGGAQPRRSALRRCSPSWRARRGVAQSFRLRRARGAPTSGSTRVAPAGRRFVRHGQDRRRRRSPTGSARPGRHLVQNCARRAGRGARCSAPTWRRWRWRSATLSAPKGRGERHRARPSRPARSR